MAERQWPEVGHPPAKAEGKANAGNDVAGKRTTIKDQVRRRACLRPAKGQDEALLRTIGIDRATVKIGMANLAYNMLRYVFHEGRRAAA